jgi:hypothetical protein
VNVGPIAHLVELGVLATGEMPGAKKSKSAAPAPITVNQELLRAAGLVRTLNKPLKVLGHGEIAVPLFVVADAVSGSARAKIEAAGGSVSLLEVPSEPRPALGRDVQADAAPQSAAAEAVVAEPSADDPAEA